MRVDIEKWITILIELHKWQADGLDALNLQIAPAWVTWQKVCKNQCKFDLISNLHCSMFFAIENFVQKSVVCKASKAFGPTLEYATRTNNRVPT